MSSQTDTFKITESVLSPLKRHFNMEFDADQVRDFVKYLSHYTEQTLNKAMDRILQEMKTKPRLAHIMEACKAAEPKPVRDMQVKDDEFVRYHMPEKGNAFLRTSKGQAAIEANVAHAAWIWASDGKAPEEFSINHAMLARIEAIQTMSQWPDQDSKEYRDFKKLFDMIEQQNYELADKYRGDLAKVSEDAFL